MTPIPFRLREVYPEPNPMQAEVLPRWSPGKGSAIISAPTGSGKTLFADMMLEHHGAERCRTVLYAAPFKALAQERLRDWRATFPDLRIEICTGDSTLTERDAARLDAADAIICTYESLNLRCTQFKTEERNAWLENCALVCDEIHLLGDRERGHVLEVLLMSFRAVSPKAEILGLSATLGEPERIAEWLGAKVIVSDKRAVPLYITFHPEGKGGLAAKGEYITPRESTVLALLRRHRGDKAIVFSPTRADTARLAWLLGENGFAARKHNAALGLDERLEVEAEFREGDLEVICATSTLSAGINAPARRVIIAGIRRGKTPYTAIELNQMAGRAGRPRYDTEGNAHIVCAATDDIGGLRDHMSDIRTDSALGESTPTGRRNLQFHLNNAIYRKAIQTRGEAEDWYKRSLAWLQRPELPDVDGALDKLLHLGTVEEEGSAGLQTTRLGRVAAAMALYPDDVSTWRTSFSEVAQNYLWGDDIAVAAALVHPSQLYQTNYVTREEEDELTAWVARHPAANALLLKRGIQFCKSTYVNHLCFTDPGQDWRVRQVRADLERWLAAVSWIMSMTGFEVREELKRTGVRLTYAVSPDGVKLVGLVGIGHARAMKLLGAGIKEFGDILDRQAEVKKLLGERVGEHVIAQAGRKAHAMALGKLTEEAKP